MTPAQPARPGRAHPDLAGRAQGAHTPHAAVHRGPGWWARTVTSPALRAALGVTAAVCALGAVILARTEHAVAWHATGTFIGAVGGLILGTLIVDAAAPLLTSRAQRAGVRVLRSRWWFGLLLALVAGWLVATSPGDQPAGSAPVSALIVVMVASGLLWVYTGLVARDHAEHDPTPIKVPR